MGQLLAAKAVGIAPHQIQRGISIADQLPGCIHREPAGVGKQQVDRVAALSPELHVAKATAMAVRHVQPAHLVANGAAVLWLSVSPRRRITVVRRDLPSNHLSSAALGKFAWFPARPMAGDPFFCKAS